MQEGQFSFNKKMWLFTLTVAAFSLVIISSCKGKDSKFPTCVKISKAQLQKWLNKGYNDTTNKDYITVFRFKTAYAFPGTGFRVFVIGQRKDGSLVDESLTELTAVDSCDKTHIKLTDFIFTGVDQALWSEMHVLKNPSTLIDSLLYLKLTPYDLLDPGTQLHFLAYHFYQVKKGGVITGPSINASSYLKSDGPFPCPPCPNCKSCPPPQECTNCNIGADTTHIP